MLFGNKPKIFCIGRNKTGTTSMRRAFEIHGFKVGSQRKAEHLIDAYAKRDFKRIIKYCRSAQAFQDIPFSLPYTYQFMDNAYPNSKFILTVRDSEEQWYQSVVKFLSKILETKGAPTKADLQASNYVYKGWMWQTRQIIYSEMQENDVFNKKIMTNHYKKHNDEVKEYFRFKDNLLVINLSDANAYTKFCNFLSIKPMMETFPWENKT